MLSNTSIYNSCQTTITHVHALIFFCFIPVPNDIIDQLVHNGITFMIKLKYVKVKTVIKMSGTWLCVFFCLSYVSFYLVISPDDTHERMKAAVLWTQELFVDISNEVRLLSTILLLTVPWSDSWIASRREVYPQLNQYGHQM